MKTHSFPYEIVTFIWTAERSRIRRDVFQVSERRSLFFLIDTVAILAQGKCIVRAKMGGRNWRSKFEVQIRGSNSKKMEVCGIWGNLGN